MSGQGAIDWQSSSTGGIRTSADSLAGGRRGIVAKYTEIEILTRRHDDLTSKSRQELGQRLEEETASKRAIGLAPWAARG